MQQWIKRTWILVLIGVMILSTGCEKKEEPADTQNTAVEEKKTTVEAFGIVEAKEIKNILIDFPASLETLPVEDGQKIKQGEVLATLNIKDFDVQVQSQQHALNIAQSERNMIQETIFGDVNQDPEMKRVLNDLKHAQDLYTQGQEELASQETLYKEGAISQTDFENFKKSIDAKRKAVEDATYALESTKHNKKKEVEQLKIQNEKIASLSYDLKVLQEKINKGYIQGNSVISDMANGVVFEIGYFPGDILSPEKKLMSIMNLDKLVINAEVAEEFIKDVKVGAAVKIIPLADKSKEYKGKVVSIAHQAIQKNGETIIPVEISIENRDEFLLPNFNVDVEISIQ